MAARSSAMAVAGSTPVSLPPEKEIERASNTDEEAGSNEPPPEWSNEKLTRVDSRQSFNQAIGVTKIESLYRVFGKGWKLWVLWISIAMIAFCWSLAVITTSIYGAFATSAFGKHTIVGTSAVITNIIAAVMLPVLARLCDVLSRPMAMTIAVFLFTLGHLVVASAPTIYAVVAGEAIFTAGRGGLYQIMHILISDITPLKWRGAVLGSYAMPFIMNGFLVGEIIAGVGFYLWRWVFGMFCIIVPVCIAPSLIVLFWGDRKAKRLGALSLASSTYARRRVLEGEHAAPRIGKWEMAQNLFHQIDVIGLTLFTVSLALLLTPPTLSGIVKNGNKNPSIIAMYTVGGVLFIVFIVWEYYFARYPICPRRLLNRTFLACLIVDALHFFSGYLTDAYYNSWVFIIKPQWSSRNYSYFSNIHNCGLAFFAMCTGLILRYTKKYRYVQMAGIAIRCIGEGLNYMTHDPRYQSDAHFVMAKLIISMGAGVIVCTTAVAAPASAPHADLASSMAILHMVAQLGGSIAGSISGSVWNAKVPANLKKYLPELTQAERDKIFSTINYARRAQPHDMVVRAYSEAMAPLLIGAIVTTCAAFIISWFTVEIYLGQNHNAVETHKEVRMRDKSEVTDEAIRQEVREAEERARNQIHPKCPAGLQAGTAPGR